MNTYELVCEVLKELGVLEEALAEKEASNWKDNESISSNYFSHWFDWGKSDRGIAFWSEINSKVAEIIPTATIKGLGEGNLLKGKLAIYHDLLSQFSSNKHSKGFCAALTQYSYIHMEHLPELCEQEPENYRGYWFPIADKAPDINRISALNAAIKLTEEKLKEE